MGVDHGRLHALVSEVLLHLADIHAAHEQVRGKGVSQGMHAGVLHDLGAHYRLAHDSLQNLFISMMPPHGTGRGSTDLCLAGNTYCHPHS